MRCWAIAGALLIGFTLPAAARDLDAKFLIERKGKVIGCPAGALTGLGLDPQRFHLVEAGVGEPFA